MSVGSKLKKFFGAEPRHRRHRSGAQRKKKAKRNRRTPPRNANGRFRKRR